MSAVGLRCVGMIAAFDTAQRGAAVTCCLSNRASQDRWRRLLGVGAALSAPFRQAFGSWSQWPGLNRRPTVYETVALPLSYIGLSGRRMRRRRTGYSRVRAPGQAFRIPESAPNLAGSRWRQSLPNAQPAGNVQDARIRFIGPPAGKTHTESMSARNLRGLVFANEDDRDKRLGEDLGSAGTRRYCRRVWTGRAERLTFLLVSLK